MRLYVTNLPADATAAELAALFAPFGEVKASTAWVVTVGRVGVITLLGASGPVPDFGTVRCRGRTVGVRAAASWDQAVNLPAGGGPF